MAAISFGGTASRAMRERATINKYNVIDTQQALANKASLDEVNLEPAESMANKIANDKMIQELGDAESIQETQEILEYYGSDMTVKEAQLQVDALEMANTETLAKIATQQETRDLELSQVDELVDRSISEEIIKESVGEFADIESISDSEFKVTGKGGASYDIKIMPEVEFQSEYGIDKRGVWDPATNTITLPQDATDYTLAHENVHMMRDLGIIEQSEFNQLINDARKSASKEELEAVKDLEQEVQDQEIVSSFIEKIKSSGVVPKQLETLWEKIKRWSRDFIAKFTPMIERSGLSIAEDVLAGKPLERQPQRMEAQQDIESADVTKFSREQQQNKERWLSVTLAKMMYRDNITDDQAKEILKENNVTNENLQNDIIRKSQTIKNAIMKEVQAVQDDRVINQAIRRAEINIYYRDLIDKTYREGFETGEAIEKARKDLESRAKKERERGFKTPENIYLLAQKINNEIAEDIDTENIVKKVETDVRDVLISEGVLQKGKPYKSSYEYIESLKTVYTAIGNRLLRDVPPGATKEKLRAKLRELKDYKRAASITSNAQQTFDSISNSREKADIKKVQAAVNKTLKPFKKPIKKNEESLKSKWSKEYHNAINWAIKNIFNSDIDDANKSISELNTLIKGQSELETTDQELSIIEANMKLSIANILYPIKHSGLNALELEAYHNELKYFIEKGQKDLQERLLENSKKVEGAKKNLLKSISNQLKLSPKSKTFLGEIFEKASFVTKIESPVETMEKTFSLGLDESEMKFIYDAINDSSFGIRNQQLFMDRMAEQIEALSTKHLDVSMKGFLGKSIGDLAKEKVPGTESLSLDRRTVLTRGELMNMYAVIRQNQAERLAENGNTEYKYLRDRIKEIKDLLGPDVINFMDEVSDLLTSNFKEIDEQTRKHFGHGIVNTENYYYPIDNNMRKGGFNAQYQGVNFYQSFINPRVLHKNPPAQRNYIAVLNNHFENVGNFLNVTDSAIFNRDTFLGKDVIEKLTNLEGQSYVEDYISNITDFSVNEAVIKSNEVGKLPLLNSLRRYASITLLGGSGTSSSRQLVGGYPNLMLKIGATRTKEVMKNTLKLLNDPEMRDLLVMYLKDPYMRGRLQKGFSEEMINSINVSGPKAWRKLIQSLMLVPAAGDYLINSVIASGIHYNALKSDKYSGFSPEEQKQRIMSDILSITESSQQASIVSFMPKFLRSGGQSWKLMFQFLSNQLLQAGFYARKLREIKSLNRQGKKAEARKQAGYLILQQHAIVGGTQALVGLAYSWLSQGGEVEEDDLYQAAITMASGPVAASVMVAGIIESILSQVFDQRSYPHELPAFKIKDDIGIVVEMTKNALFDGDLDEAAEDFEKLVKQLLPLYRQGKKVYDGNK